MTPGAAFAVDFNITGFVRQEVGVSITDDAYNHKSWNPAIDRTIFQPNFASGNPLTTGAFTQLDANNAPIPFPAAPPGPAGADGGATGNGCVGANFFGLGALDAGDCGPAGTANPFGAARYGDVPFNLFNTRAEVEVQAKFNENVAAYARFRAYFDGSSAFSDDNVQIEKHFLADTGFGNGRGNLLEVQSNDFMLDIPSFYFDFNFGSAWFRVGQQQIAWGEALFFRVFDVANGLDLRRHLFLDVAAEEFADERVASPGVRASYTFGNGWEVDAFVQMFSPTLYPNTNTPYAVIGQDFTVNRESITGPGFEEAENSLNFGARLIMPDLFIQDLTVSVMGVNRRNPDGVFKWDNAHAVPINATSASRQGLNTFCNVSAQFGLGTAGAPLYGQNGGAIGPNGQPFGAQPDGSFAGGTNESCSQPFEQDAFGTMSVLDWWTQAARARFDPVAGATAAIGEWAGSNGFTQFIGPGGFGTTGGGVIGLPNFIGIGKRADGKWDLVDVSGSVAATADHAAQLAALQACTASNSCTPATGRTRKAAGIGLVNGFFTNFGSLRGHLSREFKRENIVGVGFNYIITAEPGTLLDQLIVRGEMSYTPDKVFTSIDASTLFTTSDEILASVILEKYHSVFDAIPATYFVFQWMHRTDTDLGGRLLDGYSDGKDLFFEDEDGSPDGQSSANYLVFAFQQPFPNLIWRADFAMLADVQGGIFFQPGLRYKPSGEWQFDLYANIAADVGGKTDDMLESFDDMDEVFVRATYYF
ncbi:MAG: DUF1302 family protein [Gammaproteobacteria bacterium]